MQHSFIIIFIPKISLTRVMFMSICLTHNIMCDNEIKMSCLFQWTVRKSDRGKMRFIILHTQAFMVKHCVSFNYHHFIL
jgi:hypothetical protein